MVSTINPVPSRQLRGWDNGDGTFTGASAPAVAGTPISVSTTATNATATATMPAVPGKTNYVTGIIVTSGFPAAATSVTGTITGLSPVATNFVFAASATAAVPYQPPITVAQPAQGVNLAVTVAVPAMGAGVVVAVQIFGFVV